MSLLFPPARRRFVTDARPSAPRRLRARLADFPWGRIAVYVLAIAAIGLLFSSRIDIDTIHREAARLNGFVAFGFLVLLPLIGFPASLLHVAAGIRFGVILGLGLVILSIGLQLLLSYALVRLWHRHFEAARWLRKLRARVPQGAHGSVCAFTVLLPGAPYAAINYALPLMGVPLRTLLLCAWPLHALRSTVTVGFGGHSANLTGTRLAGLIVYALTILAASGWAYRRLQSRFADPPSAAGDRTPRG